MTDPINNIRPGAPLTDKQKEELAKANAEASAEAHRMAADQRARDERERPVGQVVADSIKDKLQREEFQGTPAPEEQ